nr:aldehyde oxidase GLOX-like [Tanacetum cinerariifolium]
MALTLILLILIATIFTITTTVIATGNWTLLHANIGITAMHMQLLPNDRILIFDRTDFGPSNISLADGKCREDDDDLVLKKDCTAHSIEYDVLTNSIRPLMVQTDVWCSSGALMPDGTVVQTGGFNDGDHVVRVYDSCDKCDWKEIKSGLIKRRWTFPEIPGGDPRNYPSTGSAVLLPMRILKGNVGVVEVLVCGGAPKGAFSKALNGT